MKKIYLLNSRDNIVMESFEILLEEIGEEKDKINNKKFNEVFNEHENLITELNEQNIDYDKLKNTLIPTTKKKEDLALLFNINEIDKLNGIDYGSVVFEELLDVISQPKFKESNYFLYHGDILLKEEHIEKVYSYINKSENIIRELPINSDCFVVYIKGASKSLIDDINNNLKGKKYYIGYIKSRNDLIFQSILSLAPLAPLGLVYKNNIILPQLYGEDIIERYNFSEYNFNLVGVTDHLFHLFLVPKIRNILGDKKDFENNISLILNKNIKLNDYISVLKPDKYKYLIDKKRETLKNSGLLKLSYTELKELIESKFSSSDIFNLEEFEYGYKFNIEMWVPYNNTFKSHTVAFMIDEKKSKFNVITMY